MKTNHVSVASHLAISRTALVSLFLLVCSTTLMSQTPVNFSGKWVYDKTKSTPGTNNADYPGPITREITQTASTLTYRDIYAPTGSDPFITSDVVLNLTGKEDIDKSEPNVTLTNSLKWLPGNKSFTITFMTKYIDEGKSKEILIKETYALSDNGKTLTINEYHKAELGETKATNVYHKK